MTSNEKLHSTGLKNVNVKPFHIILKHSMFQTENLPEHYCKPSTILLQREKYFLALEGKSSVEL